MADQAVLLWRRADGETTVEVHGELDTFNAEGVFSEVERTAGGLGADCLVVDLVGVTFCGAAGVRAIARLAGALHGVRPLRFVIASGGCVERLLTLAELRGPLSDLLSVAGEGSGTSGNRRSGGELGARRLG